MQGMREAGLHRRRKKWCAPREVKKLEQGLGEDTEAIFLLLLLLFLITELPSNGKRTGSGGVLTHKCSSYSRRHRVMSGLEPHREELPFLSPSFSALLGRSHRGTDQTLPSSYSLSASDMMIFGLFPPSSRVTLLRLLSAAAFWIRCPTCRESRAGVGINSHISKGALGLHLSQHLMLIPSLSGL